MVRSLWSGHMFILEALRCAARSERTRIAGELRSGAAQGIGEVPSEHSDALRRESVSALRVAMRQHLVHCCLPLKRHENEPRLPAGA